ncbi:hypothetical protein Tco_0217465 [Tanacetum coccineum]
MADFHHLDDAKVIGGSKKPDLDGNVESKKMRKSMLKQEFANIKISESGGLHKGYDRFQKVLSQLNQMQARPDNEDCNMKFLRALPRLLSWGHFAKKKCTERRGFKDRYSHLRIKELDKSEEPKALVSVDSMLNWSDHESEDMEKGASEVYGMIAGYGDDTIIPTGDAPDGSGIDSVSADGVFVAAGNGSDGVSVNAGVGADSVQSCPFGCNHIYTELKKEFDNLEVQYKECFLQSKHTNKFTSNLEQQKSWYQNNQLALEEKIRILTADLGNTTNMLKYTEKLNEQAKLDNMNTKVKLEESNARFDKWKESSKNLVKLINSSMSSRSKFGLGYGDTFGSDEVFDLSAPSISLTTSLKDA